MTGRTTAPGGGGVLERYDFPQQESKNQPTQSAVLLLKIKLSEQRRHKQP